MKVVVLGGCGVEGSSVCRDLIKGDDVEKVIIADKVVDMTRVHEKVRNSKKISTQTVDITDHEALSKVIRGNDVVVNCVGPFYKVSIPTMKVAIKAGINYLDICDDYDVVLKLIDTMDKPAKEAGVSLCSGFGSGPGFNNILIKYTADKMDQVDDILIYWATSMLDGVGLNAIKHGFHCMEGNIPQYLDGKLVNVPAGSGIEEYDFGGEFGKCTMAYIGHPEPVTIPRYIKGVKNVINRGIVLPQWVTRLMYDLVKYGFADTEPIRVGDSSVTPRDFAAQIMMNSPTFKKQLEGTFTLSPNDIIVRGKEGNKSVTYLYRLAGKQVPGTAIPASICAQMLGRGEIKDKGVVFPEAVDAKKVIAEFAKRGARLVAHKTVKEDIAL